MKKTFRKITAMVTALLTAACLMAPMTMSYTAFAAGSITISNTAAGHTYEAYQIFKGTLTNNTLTNIEWGDGVSDGAGLLTALKDITLSDNTQPFKDCADAEAVADILSNEKDRDAEITKAFAKISGGFLSNTPQGTTTGDTYEITGLPDGYYLVKDKDDTLNGANDSYTRYIVRVLGNATDIAPKDGLPTIEKKVKDADDTANTVTDFQDSADHDIGDTVEFQLTGTLPDNYADYLKYQYIIHDSLSSGLTFNSSSVVVKVGDATLTADTDYTVVTEGLDTGCTFEIKFENLKSIASITKDSEIVVTYNATLNTNAVIGSAGNPNEVQLEYSNNPNDDGADTGKTPKDKVIVFTYQTVINKIDSSNNDLTGADFTLEKNINGTWKEVTGKLATPAGDPTTFTFTGLDDGEYRLKETKTPAEYNSIDDIYFKIEATHDVTSDDPKLTELKGTSITADGAVADPATITFESSLGNGSLETNIINKKGSELPSTGGIGTTIFYVSGGALVAIAGVFLIVKKRMNSK